VTEGSSPEPHATEAAAAGSAQPLFTARFFMMCGFTFTVFLSLFQLLPTAPFRILDLGGSKAVAGLFRSGQDPISIIRWKDIHEQLEEAVDACENAADVLEAILVKNR